MNTSTQSPIEQCIQGDCREVVVAMEAERFDAIVTDPPYGLTQNKKGGTGVASVNLASPYGRARIGTGQGAGGFMGHAWDSSVPGPEYWSDFLRVAKPGAHLVAFGAPRKAHRLTCAIEDAGWEIAALTALGGVCTHDWTKAMRADGPESGLADAALLPALRADLRGVRDAEHFVFLSPQNPTIGAWVELGHAMAESVYGDLTIHGCGPNHNAWVRSTHHVLHARDEACVEWFRDELAAMRAIRGG